MAAEDDYDTALLAVATAIGTSDWATARTELLKAHTHALRIPRQLTTKDGGSLQMHALEQIKLLKEEINEQDRRGDKFETFSSGVPT